MWKEIKVVMLPASEKIKKLWQGQIAKYSLQDKLFILDEDTFQRNDLICNPQHLYFLSDEEIKEEDWYFSKIHNKIFQSIHRDQYFENEFKIIASTDLSIDLPQPSKEWIEYFVSEWNKGNKIKQVMIGYKKKLNIFIDGDITNSTFNYSLDVDSDNTIIITPIKAIFSREEVIGLVNEAYLNGIKDIGLDKHNLWIKQNLI